MGSVVSCRHEYGDGTRGRRRHRRRLPLAGPGRSRLRSGGGGRADPGGCAEGAEGILNAARQNAEEARRKAETYDADTRAAVDSYASELRRDAEQDVQKQLADGEAQARATRQAAEAMARQIEEAGWKRGQALRDESKVVEERLKKALAGLRRMVVELEELVGGSATQPESLAEALRPVGRDAQPERPVSPRSENV